MLLASDNGGDSIARQYLLFDGLRYDALSIMGSLLMLYGLMLFGLYFSDKTERKNGLVILVFGIIVAEFESIIKFIF